jgi:predicted Rossmann-fold nucleotide-binding protein
MLASVSQVYVFFPGGFGTMDELFEMLTLIQTKKVAPIKVIMVGQMFWGPLMHWVKETVYGRNKTISKEDLGLFNVVDNAHEAMVLIREMVAKKHIAHVSREQDTLEHNPAGIVMPKKSIRKTTKKSSNKTSKNAVKKTRKFNYF